MTMRSAFWRARYARWPVAPYALPAPGYTLLVPVPGDLPVFTELALAVCRQQKAVHRLETLVIPDRSHPAIDEIVRRERPTWPGALKVLDLNAADQVVLRRLGDPGRNHGAQLVRGVSRARGSHVVLHDADLFPLDARLHDDQYATTLQDDLAVTGVSPAWDPWFEARHQRELAATWELCGRVDWFRQFAPHRHFGHRSGDAGESHVFDTTFWPQLRTPANRIHVVPGAEARFVHFNYAISTYRRFQQALEPFHDSGFRILLIRVFVELFAQVPHDYGLPGLDELRAGLGEAPAGSPAVRYLPQDVASYLEVRSGLRAILAGPWSDEARATRSLEILADFDDYYGVGREARSVPISSGRSSSAAPAGGARGTTS